MAKVIKHDEQGKALFGESDHLEISQNRSFSSLIFELLSEKTPTKEEEKVFELILNLSIDHGTDTPSAEATISAAKNNKNISESVADGILQINDVHGGAQEQLMKLLFSIKRQVLSLPAGKAGIKGLVTDYLEQDKRMPGYGHRIYKDQDPRAELILNSLKENGFSDEFINISKDLEKELEAQKGTKLPLNIDGAIAVALCTFGWDAKLGKAVFIIARTPGLCGQFLNNQI